MTAYINGGSGNLAPVVVGSFEASIFGTVRAGDIDGDGHVDLAASTASGAQTVRIFLRNPVTQGWIASRTYSATLGALDDVDADGDLDVLTSGTGRGVIHRTRTFTPPTAASRKQYGSGLAGSGGLVPILGSAGVVRVGASGSMRVSNALGGAQALFGVGTAPAATPVLGGTLLITPDMVIPLTLGGAAGFPGAGYVELPWSIPPGLAGFQAFEQAAILDPNTPQGWALTQGLIIVIGP